MFKNKKNNCNKKGFSLIEMLVVLGIVVLMTGVLLTSQHNIKAGEDVVTAARNLAAQLRSSQNEALNTKQVGTTPTVACYYRTHFFGGLKFYKTAYFNCNSTPSIIDGWSDQTFYNDKQTVQLSATSPVINTDIVFSSPLGRPVNGVTYATITTTQQIILQSGTQNASVCVYASGNIVDVKGTTCP